MGSEFVYVTYQIGPLERFDRSVQSSYVVYNLNTIAQSFLSARDANYIASWAVKHDLCKRSARLHKSSAEPERFSLRVSHIEFTFQQTNLVLLLFAETSCYNLYKTCTKL